MNNLYVEVEITLKAYEFISSLSEEDYGRAIKLSKLLEKFGNNLRMPSSKNISKNIFELRDLGNSSIRLVYTFKNKKAYIFYGFIKKSGKIKRRIFLQILKIFQNL